MPLVPFEQMPADARLWVFGSPSELDEVDGAKLLGAVDKYLVGWRAHGTPLTCARELRDGHFLAVAVDERASDASGCSIDDLFRVLQEIEAGIGTSMVGGGLVYFRDASGLVHGVPRADFTHMAAMGEVTPATPTFDTTLTTVGEYRDAFERPASDGWQARLFPKRK